MKFLSIFLLITSCSSMPELGLDSSKVTEEYLASYQKLTYQLKPESQQCIQYTRKNIVKPVVEKELKEKKYEFRFKNKKTKLTALKSYNPKNFDWSTKAKLKFLYLEYPYQEKISKLHFENVSNFPDCANDFDNLNFLSAVINEMDKSDSNSNLYKQVLQKYFNYIRDNESPLIAVLTLDHVIQMLYEKGFIELKDADVYAKASNQMSNTYTEVGKSILLGFKDQDYKKLYELDKKLLEEQKKFKALIFEQVSL